jgi:3-oxoacyl-[acyl-carrier-protein] synthase II
LNNRVVVTGMGMVTPLGLDVPSTWQKLINGESGVDYITQYDPAITETKIAAEVKGFDPMQYLDRKESRHMDRFVQFAAVSALQAVNQAGLKNIPSEETGVVIGVGIGGLNTLLTQYDVLREKGADRVSPFLIPMMIPDMASGHVSIMLGAKGPNFCTASACASGSDAIGTSYETIKRGSASVMIAGGAESVIIPIAIAGFNSARALSTRNNEPKKASRPFDAERDGFIIGEGSAVLVLESLEHAERRGAAILAELIGYGATSDAFHITQPAAGGEGGARAMIAAMKEAGMEPSQIDYINAHGTSTPLNDKNETMAIKTVFKDHAYKVPVSSTKSMTGHLLGAAGSLEAAICILAIQNGIIPPTVNLTMPDPECDLDYVPNTARRATVSTALSNVFGFGGHNSTLIFRRHEGRA